MYGTIPCDGTADQYVLAESPTRVLEVNIGFTWALLDYTGNGNVRLNNVGDTVYSFVDGNDLWVRCPSAVSGDLTNVEVVVKYVD